MKKRLHTAKQIEVAGEILTWASMERETGISQNTLTQWFRQPGRKIGGSPYSLRDLSVRPDHRPPLFLSSVVLPYLEREKKR